MEIICTFTDEELASLKTDQDYFYKDFLIEKSTTSPNTKISYTPKTTPERKKKKKPTKTLKAFSEL